MGAACCGQIRAIAGWVAIAIAVSAGCTGSPHAPPPPYEIQFAAADGFPLHGTMYPVESADPPPGIVLVHDQGSDRNAWRPIMSRSRAAGYLCFAFDLRGHGASTQWNGESVTYRAFEPDDWTALQDDLAGALKPLMEAGVDPDNIAVVGAGLGASVALSLATYADWIQGVVAVSPGLELKGYRLDRLMESLRKTPLLLIAAEGDSYAASTCSTLKLMAAGFCEERLYPGTSHGTDLLALSESANDQIVQWLDGVIGAGHGADAKKAEEVR